MLLDKYEMSKSSVTECNRRIILKAREIREYNIEDYETKKICHDVLKSLKEDDIVDYSWEKHENGNILKEVWLNKTNVDKAYLEVERKPQKEINAILKEILQNTKFKQEWIEEYRKDMINYIDDKHRNSVLFPKEFAEDILKVLNEIDNGQENLKRVLSIKCFGDSKYFEKNIENVIIKIIKKYLLANEIQEEYSNDDILLEVGISKYPEVIEFCGDLEYIIQGVKIECKKETLGSYINSYDIENMKELRIKNANKVIFIENKANYVDYIYNKKAENELVIYHGGMYSPIKGKFFKKVYDTQKQSKFYHWSDIDIGGFRIFARLRKIIPELQPYKMDTESFYSKQKYWKKMNSEYIKKLLDLRNNSEYEIFYDVIDNMIENVSKLEQEAFI